MTIQENINLRTKSRTRVLMTGTLVTSEGSHRVRVHDVSRDGAQIYVNKAISEGDDVCFRRGPIFVAAHVAWCRNGMVGLKFYRELTMAERHAAFQSVVIS